MSSPASPSHPIDYDVLLREAGAAQALDGLVEALSEELSYAWLESYKAMTRHPVNVCRLYHGAFRYIYDNYSELERSGRVPYSTTIEDRVVAVYGRSGPRSDLRERRRLRGWLGPTTKVFDAATDKGHFIAHTAGGGLAVNIFPQRRDINRGWSSRGRVYRCMERCCLLNAGTFCFSRAIYDDDSSRPAEIEFGILLDRDMLWVERFENR
jgi:hypothetical protein